jgi:hypothetical protein
MYPTMVHQLACKCFSVIAFLIKIEVGCFGEGLCAAGNRVCVGEVSRMRTGECIVQTAILKFTSMESFLFGDISKVLCGE